MKETHVIILKTVSKILWLLPLCSEWPWAIEENNTKFILAI